MAALALALAVSSAPGIPRPFRPQDDPEAKNLRNPVPSTRESLAAGAQGYAKVCALCHGATGNGDGKIGGRYRGIRCKAVELD